MRAIVAARAVDNPVEKPVDARCAGCGGTGDVLWATPDGDVDGLWKSGPSAVVIQWKGGGKAVDLPWRTRGQAVEKRPSGRG